MKSTAAESTAVTIAESTTIVESTGEAATTETATTETASHAATESAGHTAPEAATAEAASVETAATHAATMETATAATKATAHAATAVATAHAATTAVATAATAPAAASTPAATRQRHCWRSQANGRNCQQRDNRLAQHHHSPSEISLPAATLFAGGNRFGKSLLDSTSPVLNSPRATADRILIRVRVAASLKQSLCCRCNLIWIFVTKKLLFGQRIESELT
jgi:hypothetical protein